MEPGMDCEFDRQLEVLLAKGYPKPAGLSADESMSLLHPLRDVVRSKTADADQETTSSRVPFVLVVSAALVRAEEMVPLVTLAGGTAPGVVDRNHGAAHGDGPTRALHDSADRRHLRACVASAGSGGHKRD
jgi:hypothetical protein